MMRRARIDHVLRAAAAVTGQSRFVVIGSAAILLRCRAIPADMLMTPEVDLYAPDAPDLEAASDAIEGAIGQGSSFHREFGYHGDGVSPGTARMPADWRERSAAVVGPGAPGVVAIVPDPDDLALSKLAAWRDKDRAWLASGMRAGLLSPLRMAERLPLMPGPDAALGMVDAAELARRIRSAAAAAGLRLAPLAEVAGGGPRP